LEHVTQELRRILRDGPARTFSTTELAGAFMGFRDVEKKHRVVVLRALRILAARNEIPIWQFIAKFEKADAEWFNPNRVGIPTHSRALETNRSSKSQLNRTRS
jgi:hypothetical protein